MCQQNAEDGRPDEPEEAAIGTAWYRRDQWPLLLETAADRSDLEETYDEWLMTIRHTIADMGSQGVRVIKVPIDMEDLLDWCKLEGREQDGAARAAYTSKKLWEMNQEK